MVARRGARLAAELIVANAPDPVFVCDLQGKIIVANHAVSELLGLRSDKVLEESLSRFLSVAETTEFVAAMREVIERGVTRDVRLRPRNASGDAIPTTLNAAALHASDGAVIGESVKRESERGFAEDVERLVGASIAAHERVAPIGDLTPGALVRIRGVDGVALLGLGKKLPHGPRLGLRRLGTMELWERR